MLRGRTVGRLGGEKAKRLVGWEAVKGVKMTEDRWRKLEVWELADDLAFKIYKVSRNFPKEEIYGITSQIRRAALSVPTNTCPVK
jgi:hypothetical protein